MLSNAKRRAVCKGLPYDLCEDDFEIPEFCPVFRERLEPKHRDWAPSLDRLIPSLGYIAGNCQVSSRKANIINNNATGSDIMKVAVWVSLRGLGRLKSFLPLGALSEFELLRGVGQLARRRVLAVELIGQLLRVAENVSNAISGSSRESRSQFSTRK